jgi:ubiquinone/menaquinone biosynthesis C-methylase UbiE
MELLRRFVEILAENPFVFIWLRQILENNFKGQKWVIDRELTVKKGERVLDLACGAGNLSVLFDDEVYTGIDINEHYITFANKHYSKKSFFAMSADKLGFPDQSFDKLFVIGLFHHVSDEVSRNILKEMKRVLKSPGKVLIMEDIPARSNLNVIGKLVHHLDRGVFIRKPEEYQDLFRDYFKVLKSYPIRTGVSDYQVFCLES